MPDPVATTSETELRAVVERALSQAYELDREIGRGGMGIVYRARDRRLKRHVAIKILPPELAFRSDIRTRFLREAETAAQLTHPHIVPIYAVDEAEGLVYFVMSCVDGDNLGKRIHDRGPLPIPEVRRILAEVADALAYAHARGVVHRDIKPDNILLDTDEDRALVTDFGIARAIIEGSDARLTATGMAIGTPAYMSPEQSAGDREIDGRSDLYALGVVAYQMLAGELPFQATSTPAMLVKHLSERPVPVDQRRPDCPRDLATIVMRLLEKEPQNRYASAAELEEALRGMPVPPPSYATTQPPLAPGPGSMGGNGAPLPPMAPVGAQGAPAGAGARAGTIPDVSFRLGGAGFDVTFGAGQGGGLQPLAGGGAAAPYGVEEVHLPTPEEQLRWEANPVQAFRRRLGWYVIINAVFLLIALFGERDFLGFTALWTIYIAFQYAKLWSDGYDWHDVLRQPRDRLFADVVAEWGDDVSAMFDEKKRGQLREKARRRRLAYSTAERPVVGRVGAGGGGGGGAAPTRPLDGAELAALGARAEPVRQALADRDEVLRLLATMPKPERDRIPDVESSARALADKVVTLGRALAELDRDAAPGAADVLEQEITRLEAAANPLDRAGSEERVRRLAYLKRQRRTIADLARRRDVAASKLEGCRLALQSMRLDLVRLRTGSGSPGQVTTLAERAMALAREVDGIVGAAGEVRAATATPAGGGRSGTPAGRA